MTPIQIIEALLTLVAGIGIFLVACTMMSTNLEAISSNSLKSLFAKTSKSKLLGVGIGTVATAAIQSSGATSVMVIGFVNAGIMTLGQAATIIYGANIGTTITGQIVALGFAGGDSVSSTIIFSALAGLGAFMMMVKNEKIKTIGGILTGFGMLFVGLELMSSSMENFAKVDAVRQFLAMISNPILLVILGAVITAIIQSSSVMTSIAIAMVVSGLISLDQGIFLTMGSNIGSCVVAIIAGLTSGKNAKRTALMHLIFNVSGVVLFMCAGGVISLCTGGTVSYGTMFESLIPNAPQTQLAMFHTVFNCLTVVIMLPLTNLLVKLVCKIIPTKESDNEGEDEPHLYFIDEHMLKTPAIAVLQTKNEIINMAEIALENFHRAFDIVCTMNYEEIDTFRRNERELNYLNCELVRFIVKLSKEPMSDKDHTYLSTAFHTITDLERVGDYAENIIEYADRMREHGEGFSAEAIEEIKELRARIDALYDKVIRAYIEESLEVLAQADEIEESIDDMTNEMADNHIDRLGRGVCTADVGAQYLSLCANSERVADHFINMAKTIRELKI